MIAFIFNSGTGKRLKEFTTDKPKALIRLKSNETLIARQIRFLKRAGIKKIIISTGPFEKQLRNEVSRIKGVSIQFIENQKYDSTNNIYSLFLAKDFLNKEAIIMHGDLVFDQSLIFEIIKSKAANLTLINKSIPLPHKDFKGELKENKVYNISVDSFSMNSYALQPIFKLSKRMVISWLKVCENYVLENKVNLYAEDALNEVIFKYPIEYFDYSSHYVDEIDTMDDYLRVTTEIEMNDSENQVLIESNFPYDEISNQLKKNHIETPFIVHGKHLQKDLYFLDFIRKYEFKFSDYSPNPTLDEVEKGLNQFISSDCDGLVAIGGGSCIDTAKAIKWYSKNPIKASNEIENKFIDLPLIVLPTTAGSGTESTQFSVIYIAQEKFSLSHHSLLPDIAILNKDFLIDLPIYQRKSTLLDALCQTIESLWSLNSTVLSTQYASQAIKMILKNYGEYIQGSNQDLKGLMLASNLAGKAINITRTSAPHAMSYKLSSIYKIAHGHAVALTLPYVYKKTLAIAESTENNELLKRFKILTQLFKVKSNEDLFHKLISTINSFDIEVPRLTIEKIQLLTSSVNKERLSNHPVNFTIEDIKEIYIESLKEKDQARHLEKIDKKL